MSEHISNPFIQQQKTMNPIVRSVMTAEHVEKAICTSIGTSIGKSNSRLKAKYFVREDPLSISTKI